MKKNGAFLIALILSLSLHGLLSLVTFFTKRLRPPLRTSSAPIRIVGVPGGALKQKTSKPAVTRSRKKNQKVQPTKKIRSPKSLSKKSRPQTSPSSRPTNSGGVALGRTGGSSLKKSLSSNFSPQDLFPTANPLSSFFSSGSQIGLRLEMPDGLTQEEQEQFEQMFASFQRRISSSYVSAFLRALNQLSQDYPYLQAPLAPRTVQMLGLLSFDENGFTKRLQTLKPAPQEKLQELFINTLKGIGQLKNPPSAFIRKGEFKVYYSLIIHP